MVTGVSTLSEVNLSAKANALTTRVVGAVRGSSGPERHCQTAVRVGRLLVYVNDREALDSFLDALHQAEALADKAFGPSDPIVYRRAP